MSADSERLYSQTELSAVSARAKAMAKREQLRELKRDLFGSMLLGTGVDPAKLSLKQLKEIAEQAGVEWSSLMPAGDQEPGGVT